MAAENKLVLVIQVNAEKLIAGPRARVGVAARGGGTGGD